MCWLSGAEREPDMMCKYNTMTFLDDSFDFCESRPVIFA